ncbi:MAG TPA: 16S rRNA (guanine(966)-N(2))-methyltransferase RsmD [Mycobacteriales bacterium]|jgi:16S rRNA (guanine966-N2)-methyltransferase|nr:16S rRNA (guanine(966)-N(2))-methyltransferase RsmD [Mycobacteriales bacterium]
MTRLISGSGGSRRLATPRGRDTRPTSDRTREALFSSLHSLCGGLDGLSFLDLYAGSGAVGLEAASRGARRVTLVERERRAARTIRANIATLGVDGVELVEAAVEQFLEREPSRYDVVYVDPPYADPVTGVLPALAAGGWLAAGAVVCVERSARDPGPAWPQGVVALRSRRYGDSALWYGRAS